MASTYILRLTLASGNASIRACWGQIRAIWLLDATVELADPALRGSREVNTVRCIDLVCLLWE